MPNISRCSWLLTPLLIYILTLTALPQTPAPTPIATVEVTQDFVDSANKAFKLVREQREALQKFKDERKATMAERQAATTLIAGLDKLVEIHKATIEAAEKLNELYVSFIETQQKFIDRLIELAKEKQRTGFLGKLWNGFKTVVTAILFFYAGRGS